MECGVCSSGEGRGSSSRRGERPRSSPGLEASGRGGGGPVGPGLDASRPRTAAAHVHLPLDRIIDSLQAIRVGRL